jgi:hypothetical protein
MAKEARQSNVWDFVVETHQLPMPAAFGGGGSGVFVNIRKDSGQVVGSVSEKGYGLIQNGDFIGTIRAALDTLGLTGYKESIVTTGVGEKLYAKYFFDNRIKALHKVGDTVGMVLDFATSFDGTIAASGELSAQALKCLNGMRLDKTMFSLYKRHTPQINLGFVSEVVGKSVAQFDKALELYEALGGVAINDGQGVIMLQHMGLSGAARDKITNLWLAPNYESSKQRNLYGLYEAITEYLRDVELTRFEQASKLNRICLKTLVSALSPEKFRELILPPIDANVIEVSATVVPSPAPLMIA